MVFKYEWGIMKFPIAAETVGKRCEELEKDHGQLTKQILLDSARNTDDDLHNLFEWNDGIAAEKYRLHQAGQVLASLKVSVIEDKDEDEPKKVKAFVQVERNDHKAIYMNVQSALKEDNTRDYVLKTALQELACFKEKYNTLIELSPVMQAIDLVTRGRND